MSKYNRHDIFFDNLICEDYSKGMIIDNLCEKYKLCDVTISRILKEGGIKTRKIREKTVDEIKNKVWKKAQGRFAKFGERARNYKTFIRRCDLWADRLNYMSIHSKPRSIKNNVLPNWMSWAPFAVKMMTSAYKKYKPGEEWVAWCDRKLVIFGRYKYVIRNETRGNEMHKFSRKDFLNILEKQQYKCTLTGLQLTPDNASPDHIVSLAEGGPHSPENIQIVLKEVNRMKSDLSTKRFVELCTLISKFNNKEN